jgi:signal transduction histidine kinase/ligand-binding sensor domain-containing protein/DNA-binding NarL/FixJ family response regulator
MFRKAVSVVLSLFLYILSFGQRIAYESFDNIKLSPEASVINCFLQDNQGLIWIGSDKGLFSYDGYSVHQHYTPGEHSNSHIYCGVIIDSTYLYLGTDNGLLIYNYRTDCYENKTDWFPPDIRTLAMDENTLWIGTLNGLFTYNFTSKKLKRFDRNKYKNIPHETIYSIINTHSQKIYIGTYNGLCSYNSETDTFTIIDLPVSIHKSNQFVNSLLEDVSRNCIWVGTEGNLFKYKPQTGKVEQIDLFHDNSVKSLTLDAYGYLLAGTDNGLYAYHESKPSLHVTHDSRNQQSLSNNIVWCVFTDKDKNIWSGTDYGISLSHYNRSFRYIPISQITGTGDGNHFCSLFKDSRGTFWFGGTNGLIRFNENSGNYDKVAWYRMGNNEYSLPHNRIRQIYEDREHQLWIASDGGINRYDYDTRKFIRYNITDSTGTYNSNWVYFMFEDTKGKLWIATCLGGIFIVDRQKLIQTSNGNFTAEYNFSTQNGLSGMFVNQITPDKDGNVWVLLYNNGINKIDASTHKITRIPIEEWTNEKNLNYILCDQEGNIWIGFRGGIVRIIPGSSKSNMIRLDEFSNNETLSMMEAGEYIWISTTDGVWTVNKQSMEAKRLRITDKVFTNLFYDSADNRIYMGGVDGFIITSPEILNTDAPAQPIYLTALFVNNRLFIPNSQSIRYSRSIILNYNQNNLSFEFSDLPYSQEEKSKFVYKLTGVDNVWNLLPQNSNRITYNNLNYGKYQLWINKLDPHGKPSDNQCTVSFFIRPPWYYTLWAKSLYLVLLVSLITWTINFFRVKNRLKYERLEKEKILEQSHSKIDFLTNLSHEFKTPLSMIIAPVSKLLLEVKNQREKQQLEIVRRNAMKLNSMIHQVLDFDRLDNNSNNFLILSQIEFISFAKSLFEVFEEDAAKEKEVVFDFYSNRTKFYIDIDVIKFESILNNLLSNAFKYTPVKGKILLSIDANEKAGTLEIVVSDTGIGVPLQDIPYIFQRFFQSSRTLGKNEGTGIGLYLVKTYTELHGGHVGIFSEEGKGTNISITLPLHTTEKPAAAEETYIEDKNTNRPLILIVEDDTEISGFIRRLLETKYHCQAVENGKIGLKLCIELMPDLIIADVMMPIMNGIEMCRRIKKHIPTSTIPIILLTAKDDKETELESIQINIDAFIRKPFDPDILLSRVDQLLNSRQQRETKARIEVISTPKIIEAVSYDEKFLSSITKIIEDRVSDSDLNVNALSELSGINAKQIYRKTKQLTGMTPVDYIKSIRMKKAAMLFSQKKFTVSEVMYMVGFSNHSYFSKCFQAEFGKTPKQFLGE